MKSLSVILFLCFSFVLIANNQVYFGFVILIFTFLTVIKFAASSVRGDFSKTADEIKPAVKKKQKIDINYLSYPEQLVMLEEIKQQAARDRATERAKRKVRVKQPRRVYIPVQNSDVSYDAFSDDDVLPMLFNNDTDNYHENFINPSLALNSAPFEEVYVNPATGLPMLSTGCSVMAAAVDVGGNLWGQSDLFNDSFSDSFSTIDDSISSFDESNDCFSTDMDDY